MQRETVGVLVGGGAAGAAAVASRAIGQSMLAKSVAAGSESKFANLLQAHPWIAALVGTGVSGGVLWAMKKEDEAAAAAIAGGLVTAVVGVSTFVERRALNKLDADTVAKLKAQGLGVAVAERSLSGAPSVTLFDGAPKLQLSGASNTPGSSSMAGNDAPSFAFGGTHFGGGF